MTHKEYIDKVNEYENKLLETTAEFVDSNKIYNVDDYLMVTFHNRAGDLIKRTCKIVNIYPQNTNVYIRDSLCKWPKGELEYFARYAWRDRNNQIIIGGVCYLGPLTHHWNNICGYAGVNWNDVKITVIKESELLGELWK